MTFVKRARISGMGSYLPQKVMRNADFEKIVDTSDEWIFSRTGIKERRIAGNLEYASGMGAKAARKALEAASLSAEQVDLILVATMTPDYISPSTAVIIQREIGAVNAAAMDLQAACSGFLYGLSTAKAFIEAGMYKNILLIASEKMSAFINYSDRNTCIIFGDGASAAVVAAVGDGLSIDSICLGAAGEMAELLLIPAGGARQPASHATVDAGLHYIKMEGKELFKHAVRQMGNAAKECIAKAGLSIAQINWLIPHQANERIMDAVAKNLEIPQEIIFKTISKYGNTSAASIPIALTELLHQNTLHQNEHLLLVAFGGGLTWGASLLTKM